MGTSNSSEIDDFGKLALGLQNVLQINGKLGIFPWFEPEYKVALKPLTIKDISQVNIVVNRKLKTSISGSSR